MADDTTLPHPAPYTTPAPIPRKIETDADVARVKTEFGGATIATKAPDTAAAKLRAFENKHLGRKAMRNKDGMVEKGFGSPFKALSPELLAEHAALEKLVEAEANVDEANAELSAAKVAHEAAKAAVVEATKAADAAAVEAKKVADEEAKADAAAH